MFGLGMSYRDMAAHVKEMYGISVSTATLSAITDKIIAKVKECCTTSSYDIVMVRLINQSLLNFLLHN